MPPKYPKKPKKPKKPKEDKKKPKKPKKKNTKMKRHNNDDTSSDIKTDTLDLNEPLRYNVKQSILDDKKMNPKDIFE